MKRLITLALLIMLWSAPAAAVEYHPGDVAVISRILKINDSANKLLTETGWDPGRPKTWTTLTPSPGIDRILPPDELFTDPLRDPEVGPGLVWRDGRVVELSLSLGEMTGVVDIGGLTELEVLKISHNRELSGVKGLGGLTKLTGLRLDGGQLADLGDLSALKELRWLIVGHNRLTEIQGLGELKELRCLVADHNQLAAADGLGELKHLRWLDLSGNQLAAFPGLGGLTELRRLDLGQNQLTALEDLGRLGELRDLTLADNLLTGLTGLKELTNLRYLFLGRNQLASLEPLDGLTRLKYLDVSGNQLTRLEGLEKLADLTLLYLDGNGRLDLGFLKKFNTDQLTNFGFSGDQFPDFSLSSKFAALEELVISGETEPRSVDLAGRRLSALRLYTHLDPSIFHNSDAVRFVNLIGDRHYRPSELRDLRRQLRVVNLIVSAPQTVTLGDVVSGLKAGRTYRLSELSPALAADFGDGTDRARIYVFTQNERKIPPPTDPKFQPPGLAGVFPNGRVTFPAPGEYYLSLSIVPTRDDKVPPAVVHYLDVFTVK